MKLNEESQVYYQGESKLSDHPVQSTYFADPTGASLFSLLFINRSGWLIRLPISRGELFHCGTSEEELHKNLSVT